MRILHLVWIMPSYSRKTKYRMHTKINNGVFDNWIEYFDSGVVILFCVSEWLVSVRHINVAVFTIRSVTYRNWRHYKCEKILHLVQRIYRNINLQIWTKLSSSVRWVTGNVTRVWRMRWLAAQILRGFSAQDHVTDTKIPDSSCYL